MGRVEGWEKILVNMVAEAKEKPFRWGSHDCVTFAARVAEALLGEKFLIPKWKTKKEAIELLRNRKLEDYVTDYLDPIKLNYVRRGDIVATMTDEGMALGVFLSPKGVFTSKNGLAYVPISQIVKAWRV